MRQSAVNLQASQWDLLKAVAFKRARETGGRPSVSAVLVELISNAEPRLRKEAEKYLAMFDL